MLPEQLQAKVSTASPYTHSPPLAMHSEQLPGTSPLQEKPLPQAGEVPVAIPPGRHKNRRESEEAARRDAALDVAAREISAVGEPDKGGAVAGQAVKPSRRLRLGLGALPEEEQLPVGFAEEEWPGDERDVGYRRGAAGGERQVDVHHM